MPTKLGIPNDLEGVGFNKTIEKTFGQYCNINSYVSKILNNTFHKELKIY